MNNLKKFENYLKKINISSEEYKIVNFGSNYFYNAKIEYNAILILLDYTTYDPHELVNNEKKIKKYCERNNLVIFSDGSVPGISSFYIADKEEYTKAQDYYYFENLSKNDVHSYMHECHKNKATPSNEKIKQIMNQYESNYLLFIKETNKKGA